MINLKLISKKNSSIDFLFIYDFEFNRDKVQVHVVVDPVLSKILRPHQREVNVFYSFSLSPKIKVKYLGCEISL